MIQISKDPNRKEVFDTFIQKNDKLLLEEKRALAFGQKKVDGQDTVYEYKNIQIRVNKDGYIVDSTVLKSEYASKKLDISRLARGKFKKTDANAAEQDVAKDAQDQKEDIYTDDVHRATIDFAQQLLAKLKFSDKVKENLTKTTKMFSSDPNDINFGKHRAEKFGENTRATTQKMIRQLDLLKTKPDDFCKMLIKEQLLNNFGSDANSFEQLLSFADEDVLIEQMKNSEQFKALRRDVSGDQKALLSDTLLTATDKLNHIAKMGDLVMNHVAGDMVHFESGFDSKGNYNSSISSQGLDGMKISASSLVDNDGNQLERRLKVDGDEFVMDFAKKESQIRREGQEPQTLNSYESQLSMNAWLLYKADRAFKFSVKLALTGVKQGVINGVGMLVPNVISIAATAIYIPIATIITVLPEIGWNAQGNFVIAKKGEEVKTLTGMHLSGHNASEVPQAVSAVTLKLVKFVVGDNGEIAGGIFGQGKALLSKDSGRVFRQGTWVSDLLNSMQGKTAKEIEDMNEGYVDFIEPFVEGTNAILKTLLPQTMGDKILSNKELSTGTLNKSWSSTLTDGAKNARNNKDFSFRQKADV